MTTTSKSRPVKTRKTHGASSIASSPISTTVTDQPPHYQQPSNFVEPQKIYVESPSQPGLVHPTMPQMASVGSSMLPQQFSSQQASYTQPLNDGDPMDQSKEPPMSPHVFASPQVPTNFGTPQQFSSAVPLYALGSSPAPADCPMCRTRAMTLTSNQVGNTTHMWAIVFCIFTGHCCCIPYITPCFKDVKHTCGQCGTPLATWKRNGRTVVHAFG